MLTPKASKIERGIVIVKNTISFVGRGNSVGKLVIVYSDSDKTKVGPKLQNIMPPITSITWHLIFHFFSLRALARKGNATPKNRCST